MKTKIQTENYSSRNDSNNGFFKFCQETSLPGWSYLNYEMIKFWKIIWIIFLFFVICLSVFVLQANVVEYLQVKLGYICLLGEVRWGEVRSGQVKSGQVHFDEVY